MSINANYNLPPGVSHSDPNAPWNEPEPPPNGVCPKCGSDDTFEANTKVVNWGVWKIKRMHICRNCWNKFDWPW
jgi:hypothetical protein